MGFLKSLKGKLAQRHSSPDRTYASSSSSYQHSNAAPPEWAPAPEVVVSLSLTLLHIQCYQCFLEQHTFGKYNEAPEDEYQAAEDFCEQHPLWAPRLLPSHIVDDITKRGCNAWGLLTPPAPRFVGEIQQGPAVLSVRTSEKCKDSCILSNVPIIGGLYDIQGKHGVYFEVCIRKMNGFIAIGQYHSNHPFIHFNDHNITSYLIS